MQDAFMRQLNAAHIRPVFTTVPVYDGIRRAGAVLHPSGYTMQPELTGTSEAIREALSRMDGVIEQACEQMLTDPRGWGVRVDRYQTSLDLSPDKEPMDAYTWSERVTAVLSPEVPYGKIHEHVHTEPDPRLPSPTDTP
jgi:hypothetical protein